MGDLMAMLALGVPSSLLALLVGEGNEFSGELWKAFAALVLIALSILLSFTNNLGLEKDMAVSITRAFLQLGIMGFVLNFIFNQSGWKALLLIFLAFCFMVSLAGYTAGKRAKGVPHSPFICGASIFMSCSFCMLMVVALRIFDPTPRYLIPIAGIMVGNCMTNTGVALKSLYQNLHQTLPLVEAALALGATPRQAVQVQIQRALVLALSPVLDNLKTLGLISLPGAMTGMILGGASPVEATKLQMIVATILVGASTLSCMLAVFLAWPCFFTPAYQVVHDVFGRELT